MGSTVSADLFNVLWQFKEQDEQTGLGDFPNSYEELTFLCHRDTKLFRNSKPTEQTSLYLTREEESSMEWSCCGSTVQFSQLLDLALILVKFLKGHFLAALNFVWIIETEFSL